MDWLNRTHVGDCRALMSQMAADGVKVQTCVTSPPYFGLRDYGHDGQIGLESSPAEYVAAMVDVFRSVRDVLADDGTLWLNLGDSYANDSKWGGSSSGKHVQALHGNTGIGRRRHTTGLKPKDLIGIPWRVAFALQADGWYLRQDIIWSKPNPMPESVRDRCTKAHEYVFLLSKLPRYYFDHEAIKEPSVSELSPRKRPNGLSVEDGKKLGINQSCGVSETRNKRSVWTVATKPYKGAHFAAFPPDLIEPCILAGSRPGDVVLDPFMGSGTTGQVATDLGRQFIGCELNPAYIELHDMRRTTIGMPL